MSEAVLESFISQYMRSQDVPEISFAWQGGEPTLMGLDFFRRVVHLQKQYLPAGKRFSNAIQTNGTLLTDEWCRFLHDNQFLVGLSIDGPRNLHDRYRRDKGGGATFDRVMEGMRRLKEHQVEFNTLTVVNRANSREPLAVYDFLREQGSGHIQFIPLVERGGSVGHLACPPGQGLVQDIPVSPWSTLPQDYGQFLCTVFDQWVKRDVGRVFVQLFEVMLGVWLGRPASLCVFNPTCGQAAVLEHNGDLYSCDHFVYPEYRLGNILQQPLASLMESEQQLAFGQNKKDFLPRYCLDCDVRFACQGECPKHRFVLSPAGQQGLNYLCPAYKQFFRHVDRKMEQMAWLLRQGRPAADIMRPASPTAAAPSNRPGRNDPCPCGSGKKLKKCCGAG
jgi:uncharacterized protein